ncbi:MAG: 2-phosphosulfolactate phosphatase [Actinomycetota bacterium]|nr:2-phosphosulfolactate phosphatase [Actinomycetota bacterium]
MRVHVAFTPAETAAAPLGIVVDVLRATSTIAQALAGGYRRVLSCADVDEARALHEADGDGVLAGERACVRIPGFDLGNSPSEFVSPNGESVILTTTNGTRALVAAASRCERVVTASLLNLEAVAATAREADANVAIMCAGVRGEFAIDDAYVAGRIVALLAGERSDAAQAAVRLALSFGTAEEGLRASRSARNLVNAGLEKDIAWCARESVLDVVPRVSEVRDASVEITALPRRNGTGPRAGGREPTR